MPRFCDLHIKSNSKQVIASKKLCCIFELILFLVTEIVH